MTSDERKEELKRLCKRFEIAAANFVNSCISMKANECAFQAWFAASMIQEFGLARVYREVHLWKDDLFGLTDRQPITSAFDQGNELFPDVSISWQPDVDARHSSTRSEGCRHAGDMLAQLAIVSEFKVTGSTSKATPRSFIRQDLAKLGVYESAARSRDDTNVLPRTWSSSITIAPQRARHVHTTMTNEFQTCLRIFVQSGRPDGRCQH
jgi:hypothetical protein